MSAPDPAQGSVGLVKTHIVKLPLPPEGFVLDSRETLPELHVAYETYGTLSPEGDNVIYICHALTGDAHVAGYHDERDRKPGWWDAMVGPGKGIDTQRFFVICSNNLGGCMGTTGPASLNPRTGKPYGSAFPAITTGDIVHVQYRLLKHLGLRRLAAVIGGSFGGMQVLEWSRRYPDMLDRCICIASAMHLSAQALAFDIVGRNAILSDPAWAGGDYYENEQLPAQGLAQARMIGHITYLSAENMRLKFGREKSDDGKPRHRFATPFQIESYLDHQGEKFVNRFDANSYLHITEAMDHYDLTEGADDPDEAFRDVDARTRFLVVALSSDWLFPPEQSADVARALVRAGKHVSYCLLRSPYGHDAFLVEVDHLTEVVQTFLAAPTQPTCACAVAPACAVEDAAAATSAKQARRQDDYHRIVALIKPGARILDLGCGDGELLCRLVALRHADGLGMDIDLRHLLAVMRKGLDVFQADLDEGLSTIPDHSYDCAVLSQTLQVVRKPRFVVSEMLRVAREGIIIFPNFGNWRHRLRLGLSGRMPVSDSLPFEWYDTPNIHLSTLKDFKAMCETDGIRITDLVTIPGDWVDSLLSRIGRRNLGADRVLIKITRA